MIVIEMIEMLQTCKPEAQIFIQKEGHNQASASMYEHTIDRCFTRSYYIERTGAECTGDNEDVLLYINPVLKTQVYPNPYRSNEIKATIKEIMKYLQNNFSDLISTTIFFNKDICNQFKISCSDSSNRLNMLRSKGLIRFNFVSRHEYGGFILTDKGIDYE